MWPRESHLQIKEEISPPTLVGWQSKLPHINLEIEPGRTTGMGHGFHSGGNNSGTITGRFSQVSGGPAGDYDASVSIALANKMFPKRQPSISRKFVPNENAK